MSTMDITGGTSKERGVKTLAIRLEPDLHAQLTLIAQLRDSTITDEIRTALAAHIALVKDQPELAARADDVLEAIEREAVTRREAISTLFGTTPDTSEDGQPQWTEQNPQDGDPVQRRHRQRQLGARSAPKTSPADELRPPARPCQANSRGPPSAAHPDGDSDSSLNPETHRCSPSDNPN